MNDNQAYHGTIVTLTSNDNYGCIIQRWALQTFLEKNFYYFNSYYLNSRYWSNWIWNTVVSPTFWLKLPIRFLYRALVTKKKPYWVYAPRPFGQMKYTNKFVQQRIRQEPFSAKRSNSYSCYIVGSDQVWREKKGSGYSRNYFLLDFVTRPDAKRIAYAASFGSDTLSGANLQGPKQAETKQLAQKFDAIGVREDSAVQLVKDAWGLEATQVVDPTLLLSSEDYCALIESPTCSLHEVKPIFYHLLSATSDKLSFIEQMAKHCDQEHAGVLTYGSDILPPVEQWLKGFRDSQFVITDSFHATVFAIIFRRPFYTFTNKRRGITRITSLLTSLGLSNRIIDESSKAIPDFSTRNNIDWPEVERRLDVLRRDSSDWLLKQLAK